MTKQHVLFPPGGINPTEPNVEEPTQNVAGGQGDPNLSITGTGISVPMGLEAIFSYNGLIMNDLSVFDKYRVMGIDGLGDPDIRDTREDKPGEDGEDAYDSYYSGRTIVLQVRVEAYEIKKLRDMEEALRNAFVNMSEKPLYFLSVNSEQDHYIMCKKSSSLTKTESVESLNFRHFRDWQITLRASDPRFYRTNEKITSSLINSEPELNPAYRFESAADPDTYQISTNLFTSAVSSAWNGTRSSGTKSLLFQENPVTSASSFQISKDFAQGATPVYYAGESVEFSGDIKFSIANSSGAEITSLQEYSVDYLLSLSFYSGSTLIKKLEQEDTVSSSILNFKFGYQIPPGTDNIKISAAVSNAIGVAPNSSIKVYLDNLSLRKSNVYDDYISCTNLGNYNTYPVITLTGKFADIELTNSNASAPFNKIKFKPAVEIIAGDTYIIDTKEKTVIDAAGNNKISQLDPSSGWLTLVPGENKLAFSASTVIGTTAGVQISVTWKDAWV